MDRSLKQAFAWLAKEQYLEAHSWAIEAIKRNVADPAPYLVLARIAAEHGNHEKAPELFERAVELAQQIPSGADTAGTALYAAYWAQYLLSMGNHPAASRILSGIHSRECRSGFVADLIGVILSRLGLHADAVPFFQRAIALDPAPANFHYNLGASLQFSGDMVGARAAYQGCIEREPNMARAWSALVSLDRQGDGDYLPQLEALFDSSDDVDSRLHAAHAIAKVLEDQGDYAHSLEWLKRGKAPKRRALDYQVEQDLALFSAAAQAVPKPLPAFECDEPAPPIFIVGLPRTGTTLVDRILSSHSQVVSCGELNTFAALIKQRVGTPSNRVLDEATLRAVAEDSLEGVGARYQQDVAHLVANAARHTDKMPLNFFYAGLILKAIPNARIIALRRDPMDSCLSNFRQLFSTGFSYYNYSLSLEDTARYYLAFDRLITHWRQVLPASRFMEVAYEDLVESQEATTRRLLSFAGLEWEERCLRFHENSAPVSTASSVQVRQPIYRGSMGRWRRYGSALDELRSVLTSAGTNPQED